MSDERISSASVLVIGTGGAGLRAAIELRERGVDVLAVGKRRRCDAHTTLAAGGINAALGTMDPEDSWQQHAADTIKESYDLADPRIVETMAPNAPQGIRELELGGCRLRGSQTAASLNDSSARTRTVEPVSPGTTPG